MDSPANLVSGAFYIVEKYGFFVASLTALRPLGAPGSIFLARGAIAPSRAAFKVAPAD